MFRFNTLGSIQGTDSASSSAAQIGRRVKEFRRVPVGEGLTMVEKIKDVEDNMDEVQKERVNTTRMREPVQAAYF